MRSKSGIGEADPGEAIEAHFGVGVLENSLREEDQPHRNANEDNVSRNPGGEIRFQSHARPTTSLGYKLNLSCRIWAAQALPNEDSDSSPRIGVSEVEWLRDFFRTYDKNFTVSSTNCAVGL